MRKLSLSATGAVAVFCTVLSALALAASAQAAAAAGPPTVSLNTVTNVTDASATIRGAVNPERAVTQYVYIYGTTPALGSYTPAALTQVGSGTGSTGSSNVTENRTLTGLTPGTTYYYELWANNAHGTQTSQVASFTTSAAATVATEPATGVGRYAATLAGTINPNSQATTYYFQYGTTTSYGLQTAPLTIAAGSTPLVVSTAVPALEPGTVFHYRLVATHGSTSGMTYPVSATTTSTVVGTDLTFQTLPWPRPASTLSLSVTPRTSKRVPVTFRASGRVGLAYTVTPALGCHGTVYVRVYQGSRQLAVSKTTVSPTCTYRTTARVAKVSGTGATHLTVQAHFDGSTWAAPSSFERLQVTVR